MKWWLCPGVALVTAGFFDGHAQSFINEPVNAEECLAVQISVAPTLDGILDDAVWQKAPRITHFVQRELQAGALSTERTEVAVAYDEQNLYLAVWCYDRNPQALIAREMRRDFDYTLDDNFMVVVDPYRDRRNGIMLVTNPIGARADLQVFNNGASTNSFWNGVWDVRTTVNDQGWFAEFVIPFYTFKYRVGLEEQEWGINFERNIRHKREQVRWQGWARDHRIEQMNLAGALRGLRHLSQKQMVEVKPYALGGVELKPNQHLPVGNLGGDVNYLLNPSYRLNMTLNTDFAQVESDQQQINLTRFPLFFPELREFFLEGDDYFNFGFGGNRIIPFYTRRMGLDDQREAVPILAGARLLGKEDDRTLGLMSIQTAQTENQASTNYTTASWRQDIGRQSVMGAMTTNRITSQRWHSTNGINGRYSTSRLWGNKNLDFGGALLHTYATEQGWNPRAMAYRFFVHYPNDRWSVFASAQRGPMDFEPEVGLMLRRGFREQFVDLAYRPRPRRLSHWVRQFDFRPVQLTHTQYDDNGAIQSLNYSMQFLGLDTKSGESLNLNHAVVAEGLRAPFPLTSGIVIPHGMYWWRQSNARIRTFKGRKLALDSRLVWGQFYDGQSVQTQTELLWRSSRYIGFNLRFEHNRIDLPQGSLETNLVGTRMTYALSPQVFGSLLGQWNSAQDELNINFRMQMIPAVGKDFFLIVNQIYNTSSGAWVPTRGTVVAKLIWRFVV
jgi:hypothetical protein